MHEKKKGNKHGMANLPRFEMFEKEKKNEWKPANGKQVWQQVMDR